MLKPGLFLIAVTAVAAAPTTTLADARDDALAAVQRCAGVTDPDTRRACFDGMVSRYRTLPPAPALSPPPPAYVPAPAYVPPPASAAPAPRAVAPPTKSLRSQGLLGSIFGSPERYPQTTIQQFGSEGLRSKGELSLAAHQPGDTVDMVSGRLTAYRTDQDGRLVVTLDNGQEWIQILGGEDARLTRPAESYSAQIRRNPNGAYALVLTGVPKPIYVRRRR